MDDERVERNNNFQSSFLIVRPVVDVMVRKQPRECLILNIFETVAHGTLAVFFIAVV